MNVLVCFRRTRKFVYSTRGEMNTYRDELSFAYLASRHLHQFVRQILGPKKGLNKKVHLNKWLNLRNSLKGGDQNLSKITRKKPKNLPENHSKNRISGNKSGSLWERAATETFLGTVSNWTVVLDGGHTLHEAAKNFKFLHVFRQFRI